MKECLCKSCFRLCKVRNENKDWVVLECNAYVKEFTQLYDRTIKVINYD